MKWAWFVCLCMCIAKDSGLGYKMVFVIGADYFLHSNITAEEQSGGKNTPAIDLHFQDIKLSPFTSFPLSLFINKILTFLLSGNLAQ